MELRLDWQFYQEGFSVRFSEHLAIGIKSRIGANSRLFLLAARLRRIAIEALDTLGVAPTFLESDKETLDRVLSQAGRMQQSAGGKHFLFFSIRGWTRHLVLESLLAALLRARGHRVTFMSCNDVLSFCMFGSESHREDARRNCAHCTDVKSRFFKHFDDIRFLCRDSASRRALQDGLNLPSIEDCESFVHQGAPYGSLVKLGLIWYLRRSRLGAADLDLYRSAIVSAHAVRVSLETYLDANPVDCAVLLNGDFSAEKTAAWVLGRRGIRYVAHDFTIGGLLAVGLNRSAWDQLTFENKSNWRSVSLPDGARRRARRLLDDWKKTGGYQGALLRNLQSLTASEVVESKLPRRPTAVAYTNLTFESSVVNKDRVFSSQFHWLERLVSYFKENNNYALTIRIHPAEARKDGWAPRESLYHFLLEFLNEVPDNIRIIGPNDSASSYSLGIAADLVLVYSSTIGIELADRGKTVLTAAHVHYAGRGFTIDPRTEREYFDTIARHLDSSAPLPEDNRRLVTDYVAWLFYHRLIPFEAIDRVDDSFPEICVGSWRKLSKLRGRGVSAILTLLEDGRAWW